MKASAADAQAPQGPRDGTWNLSDAHGHRIFIVQITDPADGGPLAGAWREAGDAAQTGRIDAIARRGRGLDRTFTSAGQGAAIVIRLEPRGARSAVAGSARTGLGAPSVCLAAPEGQVCCGAEATRQGVSGA